MCPAVIEQSSLTNMRRGALNASLAACEGVCLELTTNVRIKKQECGLGMPAALHTTPAASSEWQMVEEEKIRVASKKRVSKNFFDFRDSSTSFVNDELTAREIVSTLIVREPRHAEPRATGTQLLLAVPLYSMAGTTTTKLPKSSETPLATSTSLKFHGGRCTR
jgi:hypothetical protein